jgi:hypothetical protein
MFGKEKPTDSGTTDLRSNDEQWVSSRTCNRWGAALLLALALAVIGGGLAYLSWKPAYEAVAYLRIALHQDYVVFEPKPEDNRSYRLFVQRQIELLRNRMVINAAVHGKSKISHLPELADQNDPVAWLAKNISVKAGDKSEVYRVTFAAHDPNTAQKVVNAVLEEYFQECGMIKAKYTEDVITFLKKEQKRRQDDVARLQESVRKLSEEASGNDPIAATKRDEQTGQLRLKQKELERAESLIVERILKLDMEKLTAGRVSLLGLADTPTEPIEAFPFRNVLLASLTGFSLPFLVLIVFLTLSWVVSACFPVVKRRLA